LWNCLENTYCGLVNCFLEFNLNLNLLYIFRKKYSEELSLVELQKHSSTNAIPYEIALLSPKEIDARICTHSFE